MSNFTSSAILVIYFTVACFVLYFPILGNTFLSDDYDSLYRIYIEKRILFREFLRPGIDISFYFNYLLGGLSPVGFYIFNVAIHAANAFLLFKFARQLALFTGNVRFWFAFLSASLFLVYPFHNEAIVWLSGRLSSMACFFALLSLLYAIKTSRPFNTIVSILFYLLGLLCYESIIVLPLIVVVLNRHKIASLKDLLRYALFWVGSTVIYLLTRIVLSGTITGSYGERVSDMNEKAMNIGKVLGRLFLPPSEHTKLLLAVAILIFIAIILIQLCFLRRVLSEAGTRSVYGAVVISLLISLVLPFAFGVSTRTSEGDRLLYFPSCFVCLLAAGWILYICRTTFSRCVVSAVIVLYFCYFLERNNQQWIKASAAATAVMDAVKNKGGRQIVFINMPDELEGAFVFRNGLQKALVINKVDTGRVKVVNYLTRIEYLKTTSLIKPEVTGSSVKLFPVTRIEQDGQNRLHIVAAGNNHPWTIEKEQNLIYFWNKEKLVRLF